MPFSPVPINPAEYWTIGDMAAAYAISLRALRFYEARGLITPSRHGVTRFYDSNSRRRLEMILKGKGMGFTLTEIAALMRTADDDPTAGFEAVLQPSQIVAQIDLLQRQRDDLDRAIVALQATHARFGDSHRQIAQSA